MHKRDAVHHQPLRHGARDGTEHLLRRCAVVGLHRRILPRAFRLVCQIRLGVRVLAARHPRANAHAEARLEVDNRRTLHRFPVLRGVTRHRRLAQLDEVLVIKREKDRHAVIFGVQDARTPQLAQHTVLHALIHKGDIALILPDVAQEHILDVVFAPRVQIHQQNTVVDVVVRRLKSQIGAVGSTAAVIHAIEPLVAHVHFPQGRQVLHDQRIAVNKQHLFHCFGQHGGQEQAVERADVPAADVDFSGGALLNVRMRQIRQRAAEGGNHALQLLLVFCRNLVV